MKEIKIVLGTYNSLPVNALDEDIEYYYYNSYKPFLKLLIDNPEIKSVLYYSGPLYEWFERKKPEIIMLLRDLIKSKQIELLSGPYYNAVLPLLPSPDRKAQVESLTNYICSNFRRRPKGIYVTNGVWEPSLPATYFSTSAEYVFLDRHNFLASGIDEHNIYYPCITEDQGKKIIVYPANSSLSAEIGFTNPKEFVEKIYEKCNARFYDNFSKGKSLFALMLSGEELGSNLVGLDNIFKNNWLVEFAKELKEKNIKLSLPKDENKKLSHLKKFYFGTTADSDITKMTLNTEQRKTYELLIRHLNVDELIAMINTGQFRQFVNKYPESNNLYSKMLYVENLARYTSDKARKKSAKEIIYSAQGHDVFWHGKHCGIYDNLMRKEIYHLLLKAEKDTKTDSKFKPNLTAYDFNYDGENEVLYNGAYFNAYINSDDAAMFELDYFPTCINYCASMGKYEEFYHSDINTQEAQFDLKARNSFEDKVFKTNEKLTDYFLGNVENKIEHINYTLKNLDSDKKIINFSKIVDFSLDDKLIKLKISKDYSFRKNDIDIDYTVKNLSDDKVEFSFATSLNLAFDEWNKNSINLINNDESLSVDKKNHKKLNSLIIDDIKNKTLISLLFSQDSDIWLSPIYTQTLVYDKLYNKYQCTEFVPVWKLRLDSKQEVKINVTMSVTRS